MIASHRHARRPFRDGTRAKPQSGGMNSALLEGRNVGRDLSRRWYFVGWWLYWPTTGGKWCASTLTLQGLFAISADHETGGAGPPPHSARGGGGARAPPLFSCADPACPPCFALSPFPLRL